MSFLLTVKRLISDNSKKLVPSIVLSIADSFLNSCMYMIMFIVLISLANESFSLDILWKCSLSMIIVFILRIVVQSFAFTNAQCTGADISYGLRTVLGNHIQKLNLGFFNKNSMGKLNNVLLTDVSDFEAVITHCLCDAIKTVSFLLMAAIAMFAVEYRCGILVIVILAVAFPLLLHSGKVSSGQAIKRKVANQTSASRIVEYISGMKTFRLYQMTGIRFEKLDDSLKTLRDESIKSELKLLPLAMGFSAVNGMLIPASLILSSYLHNAKLISIPAFLIIIMMSISISSTMTSASALYPQLCSISKSAESINQILDTPCLDYRTEKFPVGNGNIEFENVCFGYDNIPVLHNINFTAKLGTLTALVGPSGSGKTTIVSLLSRFWDVDSGIISLSGTDIKTIAPETLTNHMSIVFQDVYLFSDTIYNNIKIGNPNASKEQIISAAKAACCHDFIMQMENGYDTVIGEGGSTLSGGEKQRISIARALVRNTPIILLDETTSSLDADNESEINEAINHLIENRTVIVIAHKLKTIMKAQQILVLQNGRITETGTHNELMQNENSWYRHMVEEQEKAQNWHIKNGGIINEY